MQIYYIFMASSSEDQGQHGAATFDSLPDELVLKIVKLAAQNECRISLRGFHEPHEHTFLMIIIGKICVRFRNIAADKSLWKGIVSIGDVSEEEIATLVTDFLCKETEVLRILNLRQKIIDGRRVPVDGEIIRPETIRALCEKCTDMTALRLHGLRIEEWPSSPCHPLDSLQDLVLNKLQLHRDLFGRAQFHDWFPSLKSVILDRCEPIGGESITLPDVSECKFLEEFEIRNGNYRFPTDLDEKVPLPPWLKKWIFWPERIYDVQGTEFDKNTGRFHGYLMDLLRDHMRDCEINAWLQ